MNKTYCPLPFRHVFVESRGVKPCCSFATIQDQTIEQWLSSDQLRKIQQTFLQGKMPADCRACRDAEARGALSTRLESITHYGTETFTDTKIDYIDYRANNICNFRCRSCEPFYSNGIANEIKKHNEFREFLQTNYTYHSIIPETKTVSAEDKDFDWIMDHLPDIKRLMITGGEPTKNPEVKSIIDQIIASGNTDISLMITSNASFTDPYWIEITKQLPNIHWTLSVDAVGMAAEIIRDGTNWPIINRNVEALFDIAPSVNIGTVITNLSLFQLKPLFRYVNDLARKYSHRTNGRTQFLYLCQYPAYMAPWVLSPELKIKAKEYLSTFDESMLQTSQLDTIKSLQNILKNSKRPPRTRWTRSVQYNDLLDKIRDQNHAWLFEPAD